MAYDEPDLPVAGNPVSTSAFGFKARDSIIWLKSQVDALLGGGIVNRKGGSATDFSVGGTTDYVLPANPLIQVGVAVFPGNNTQLNIPFPVAFSDCPIVLSGGLYAIGGGSSSGIPISYVSIKPSATQFYLNTALTINSGNFSVPWIAIGPA